MLQSDVVTHVPLLYVCYMPYVMCVTTHTVVNLKLTNFMKHTKVPMLLDLRYCTLFTKAMKMLCKAKAAISYFFPFKAQKWI